ncbi:N-acetyltransferase [Bacteroidales bacterium]|nr:N-acetyltransferase [Bacteroidales bacterium]
MSKFCKSSDFVIIDPTSQIGEGTTIWYFSQVMAYAVIGKSCNIGQNVVISPKVVLGNNVKIQNNVSVYTGVVCEDDVFLGPSCVFTNILNPRSAICRKEQYVQTRVKKGASIGANATIICGVSIGEYALVGAGSVVTKDVLPYALVFGNPAKQVGWVSEYGNKLVFDKNNTAFCEESKQTYSLKEGRISRIS